jgi:hypothetical protein
MKPGASTRPEQSSSGCPERGQAPDLRDAAPSDGDIHPLGRSPRAVHNGGISNDERRRHFSSAASALVIVCSPNSYRDKAPGLSD